VRLGVFVAILAVLVWIALAVTPTGRLTPPPPNADLPRPPTIRCLQLAFPWTESYGFTPELAVLDTVVRHEWRGHVVYYAAYRMRDSTWTGWAAWAPAGDSMYLMLEDWPAYHLPVSGDTLRASVTPAADETILGMLMEAGRRRISPLTAVWTPCPKPPRARAPNPRLQRSGQGS
jgi:hypothetical protein